MRLLRPVAAAVLLLLVQAASARADEAEIRAALLKKVTLEFYDIPLREAVDTLEKKFGVTVNLPAPVDEAQIINLALAGKTDAFLWRNYPGSDPDTLYVWFHSGSPVNFNKINDPVIDKALGEMLNRELVSTDEVADLLLDVRLLLTASASSTTEV